MTETTPFHCDECFDTQTIDRGGREIACPYCVITLKITGLGHALGILGNRYETATSCTRSTITFEGTRSAIIADAVSVTRQAFAEARAAKRFGRNDITSGPLAIERKVIGALR